MQTARTAEKVYHINDRGRVLKRNLKQDEYYILSNGERLVPPLVVERLQNEAACMEFVRKHTNIPVPKPLNTYEEDGSYHLWMEFIDGVEMNKLTQREQTKLFPQIQNIITTLQAFRSKYSGGPTGILSPPPTVYFHHFSKWKQLFSPEAEFVFCHGDLSQGNILVNRETLCIVAIIDWEYIGFFPRKLELPFYKSSKRSGEQVKGKEFRPYVDRIIEFWRQSQTNNLSLDLTEMYPALKLFSTSFPSLKSIVVPPGCRCVSNVISIMPIIFTSFLLNSLEGH